MKLSLRTTVALLLISAASVWAAEPLVIQQQNVIPSGFLGLKRRVTSKTLILPDTGGVLRRQNAREQHRALRETQAEAQRQADARRKAEADSMASVGPAPGDAPSAEAAMAEATSGYTSEPVAEHPAPASDASPADAAADDANPSAEADTAAQSSAAEAPEAAAPAEQPAEAAPGE